MRCNFLRFFPASPYLYYSQQDVYNICICSLFFTMTGFGDTSTTMYMSKISGHAPPVPPAWWVGGGGGVIFQISFSMAIWRKCLGHASDGFSSKPFSKQIACYVSAPTLQMKFPGMKFFLIQPGH